MYITEDTGLIYLDTTNTESGRICLNGVCAEYLREILYNDDGTVKVTHTLSYADVLTMRQTLNDVRASTDTHSQTITSILEALDAINDEIASQAN